MTEGCIFVLTNDSMPNLIYIGYTKDSCPKKVANLFSAGVPEPFIIDLYVHLPNAKEVLADIYGLLGKSRVRPDRCFFRKSLYEFEILIQEKMPELVWQQGLQYTIYDEDTHIYTQLLETIYNRIYSEVEEFTKYLEENNYFYDTQMKIRRQSYEINVIEHLKFLRDTLNKRLALIKENLAFYKKDDKYMKEMLESLSENIKRMMRKTDFPAYPM